MKKVVLAFSVLAMSFSALAGGGGSSWQPSVGPAYCIKNSAAPQEGQVWSDIPACNEVCRKDHASSVCGIRGPRI